MDITWENENLQKGLCPDCEAAETAIIPTEITENRGQREYQGFDGHTVTKEGALLHPERSLKVWNHSPTGFSWGYAGSGPAQLALAILLEETDQKTASALHQIFKFEVIAGLAQEWTLTSAQVQEWLQDQTQWKMP